MGQELSVEIGFLVSAMTVRSSASKERNWVCYFRFLEGAKASFKSESLFAQFLAIGVAPALEDNCICKNWLFFKCNVSILCSGIGSLYEKKSFEVVICIKCSIYFTTI